MKLLRNKSLSTQILILYELYNGHYSKLAPLAQKIGVTQQAVSEYINKMKKEGLVQKIDRQYKPTVRGVSLLQQEILNLKEFTDDCMQHLSLIKNCIAIASTKIKKGQNVTLSMQDGWLYASTSGTFNSSGTALADAEKEDAIAIGNLKGILDHSTGKISFLSVRDPFLPTKQSIDIDKIKQQLKKTTVESISVLDPYAKVITKKIGVKSDIEYGGIHAIIDAAQRGLNITVIGYKQTIQNAITYLDKHNEQSTQPLDYDVFTFY